MRIKKRASSSETRSTPLGAWKMPPMAQPLCFRESTGVNKAGMGRQQTLSSGSEDSTRPVNLGYARQLQLAGFHGSV
ncbi:MAG: hypothetical protein ACUVV5_08635 [Candidatus Aminicenantales bacterium]